MGEILIVMGVTFGPPLYLMGAQLVYELLHGYRKSLRLFLAVFWPFCLCLIAILPKD